MDGYSVKPSPFKGTLICKNNLRKDYSIDPTDRDELKAYFWLIFHKRVQRDH